MENAAQQLLQQLLATAAASAPAPAPAPAAPAPAPARARHRSRSPINATSQLSREQRVQLAIERQHSVAMLAAQKVLDTSTSTVTPQLDKLVDMLNSLRAQIQHIADQVAAIQAKVNRFEIANDPQDSD